LAHLVLDGILYRFAAALWVHIFYIQTDDGNFTLAYINLLKFALKSKQVFEGMMFKVYVSMSECAFD
jgi:hypothetical protein